MLHTVTHRHTVTHLPFPLWIKVIRSSCCTQIINFSYTPYTPYTPSILTAYTPLHTATHPLFLPYISICWSYTRKRLKLSYTPYTPYTPSILTAYTPLHTRYFLLTFQSAGPTQGRDWNWVTHPYTPFILTAYTPYTPLHTRYFFLIFLSFRSCHTRKRLKLSYTPVHTVHTFPSRAFYTLYTPLHTHRFLFSLKSSTHVETCR